VISNKANVFLQDAAQQKKRATVPKHAFKFLLIYLTNHEKNTTLPVFRSSSTRGKRKRYVRQGVWQFHVVVGKAHGVKSAICIEAILHYFAPMHAASAVLLLQQRVKNTFFKLQVF